MAAAGGPAVGGGVEDLTDTAERRGRFEPEPDADPRAGSPTEGDRRTVQRSNSSSIGASCTGLDHLTAGWGSCPVNPIRRTPAAGLLGPYPKTPGLRRGPRDPRSTPEGLPIAKDVWMLGAGLSLLIDSLRAKD